MGLIPLPPCSIPPCNQFAMVYTMAQFFLFQRFGYGSAMLWGLFVMVMIVTFITFRTVGRLVFYEVPQGRGR